MGTLEDRIHRSELGTQAPASGATRWLARDTEHGTGDTRERVHALAVDTLATYAHSDRPLLASGHDAGPIVLAACLLSVDENQYDLAHLALNRWIDGIPDDFPGIGPFGGLGGFLAGLRAAMRVNAALGSLYHSVCAKSEEWLEHIDWRFSEVAWRDYDYFTGPSGVIISGSDQSCPRSALDPALVHLRALCTPPDMERFRAGEEIDARSAFNIGKINTGLGHGLAGVAAAFTQAIQFYAVDECRRPLRKICDWLQREAFTDARGLMTWPPVGRDDGAIPEGFDFRQAWCYGTPGMAWTLWNAAQVLDDAQLAQLGTTAMSSFCQLFDPDLYIDDAPANESLSICHGVAGTIAVADAFGRHANLAIATDLKHHLVDYLLERTGEVRALGQTDMSMLSGTGGIMSVLLTAMGGDRTWLSQLTLR